MKKLLLLFCSIFCCQFLGATVDLELSLQSDSQLIPFTVATFTLQLSNTGDQAATDIIVEVPAPDLVLYQGSNEYRASAGTFDPYGDQWWRLPTLAAGQSATLTLNYFVLETDQITCSAQVWQASSEDVDSTPGNGTLGTVQEDDEVSLSLATGCGLLPTISNLRCDDAGTPNEDSDDVYFFDLVVTKKRGETVGYLANLLANPLRSLQYNQVYTFGPYNIQNTPNILVNISDSTDATCRTEIRVTAPTTCSDLPNDVDGLRWRNWEVPDEVTENILFNLPVAIINRKENQPVSGIANIYLSTDNQLDGNDPSVGNLSLENVTPNTTFGSATVIDLTGFSPGDYFLIGSLSSGAVQQAPIKILPAETTEPSDLALQLGIRSSVARVSPFINFSAEYFVTNPRNNPATDLAISIPRPNGVTFQGNDVYATSYGIYDWVAEQQVWQIPQLSAGETASLRVNYFVLGSEPVYLRAALLSDAETQLDSTLMIPNQTFAMMEMNRLPNVKIYPNPVTNTLNLNLSDGTSFERLVKIFDMNGRLLQTHTLSADQVYLQINTDQLPAGVFQLNIQGDAKQEMYRFVKQ